MTDTSALLEISELPDGMARQRYEGLVGLDATKTRLVKEAQLLLDPLRLEAWSKKHHGQPRITAAETFRQRTPLFVFTGDVGTGKTALAETFGDAVARDLSIGIYLCRLSLSARGAGAVGEMTRLISDAFLEVERIVPQANEGGRVGQAGILLIDEADALAQSRELAQMHHEDRAGVNALIRGIDRLRVARHPVLTVMASNRLSALDPAVRRRAAGIFDFPRPNEEQRKALLARHLTDAGLSAEDVAALAHLTGDHGREYGYTYSDLIERLIPAAVLAAYPDIPLTLDTVIEQVAENPPTPPFAQEAR